MAKSPGNIAFLSKTLSEYGLVVFGGLVLSANECAQGDEALIGKKALLIGNAGPDMWACFSKSDEFMDGTENPMNRWTRRVLDHVCAGLESRVVYPFDEPYWPFQRLAQKAAGVKPSPLGILIHPEFGLWHAFRGLVIFDDCQDSSNEISRLLMSDDRLIHPCDSCLDKPCLSACPVGAFTGERLDVESCFTHIDSSADPDCMSLGCRARCACPIGKEYQNNEAQIRFHMKSYRGL